MGTLWGKRLRRRKKVEIPETAISLMMHFPGLWNSDIDESEFIASLSCSECADLKAGVCKGEGLKAEEVVDCMSRKHMEDFECC